MGRNSSIALVAGLLVAGCVGAPPEKPVSVLTEHGALLMRAAPAPDREFGLARLLCAKRGLNQGTHEFVRCVMRLYGRDRALTRARAAARRMRPALCMTLGDFTLTRCIDI